MTNFTFKRNICLLLILVLPFVAIYAQSITSPQVNFSQRSSTATPTKTIYSIKGDFTMLGNTNLTLVNYGVTTNNEGNAMKYIDIDGDATTLNSSMATLEVSNSGENSANPNCSTVLFAGIYWTGKSDDANESFSVTKNSVTKNYNKKVISLKGPGASTYTTVTASSEIRFPGAAQSGIFVGYQEVTTYVKTHGAGAYTVADIALKEGTNNNPGLSGGWVMIVIYANPLMKSRAVTLFDGYAYVNGQNPAVLAPAGNGIQGEYGNINISGITTVGAGPVNMKLGVMAAEGDVGPAIGNNDYLAVQKLAADPALYPVNYSILNHSSNTTTNFFNSSIFPVPASGNSNPILQNNTGVDFSMFTIPNIGNLVIGNNQTSTSFRYGSSYEVFTIFGFVMSVDTYVPEPEGIIAINTIAGAIPSLPLTASPGNEIEYKVDVKNKGSEPTKNTIITIPIPTSAVYTPGSIQTSSINSLFTPANAPYFDSGSNSIIWNIGIIPLLVNPNTLLGSLIFKVTVTTDCASLFNAGCNNSIALHGAITGSGTISNTSFGTAISQGIDPNVGCGGLIEQPILVNFNSSSSPCFAVLAGNDTAPPVCGLEVVTLGATAGTSGSWSIVSQPSGSGGIFSNINSPTSEFSSPTNGVYTLRWTIPYGGGSCTPIIDDIQVSIGLCTKLDFDGLDDNVNFNNNYNLNSGAFSIETWIKPNVTSGTIQTIFSKRNTIALTDGYDLRLVNNTISFNWNNGNSIASTFPISTGRWYHIAVTFDGTFYKLFIDGVSMHAAVAGSNPIANSSAKSILGAMIQSAVYPYLPTNYFTGWMQELRIWNVALTEAQTHQMMNQKITNNSATVIGATVPLTVPGLSWGNLEGYYQMVQSSDIVNGYLIDKTSNIRNGKLIGIVLAQSETAPLPYTSATDGVWETAATWTQGTLWNIPNTLGLDNTTFIDWNIVRTDNNISTSGNKTLLGLLVTSNTLGANSDNKIEISHYLKLEGKIDLEGKSQLVQTEGSILDPASSGSIERDQQGQANKYNYNYWSSPVSPINSTANNTNYSVASVMKDGTTAVPQNINWVGGYDGSPTSPISVARYWLYKFDNYANAYANWSQISETAAIRVGQGFTMKGSGTLAAIQNYTFVGKPNNGTINTNSVTPNQLLLTGNPYPSALDANAFINDNASSIDGTLYFWEHYTTNDTHVLREYQGGYAQRNLVGGVPPTSAGIEFISGLGASAKGIPNQFIPVGQSFFVTGSTNSGGAVIYKNSQRGFHKENENGVSNIVYKSAAANNKKNNIWKDNSNDALKKDSYKRIRLGYNSFQNYHRQLLLGFMDEKATDNMDYGYDGLNFDGRSNDMYFLNGVNLLTIQGVGFFDKKASYPIGVKADIEGKVTFMIDGLENFDENEKIFIFDSKDKTYHDLRKNNYEVIIPSGESHDRFSLCFKQEKDPKEKLPKENTQSNDIKIVHIRNKNIFEITNNPLITTIQKATLYNVIGQSIARWEIDSHIQEHIELPIKNLSSGVYVLQLQTSNGPISKKVIIP